MIRLFAALAARDPRRRAKSPMRCAFSLDELAYEYPDEPVPAGRSPDEQLAILTWQGAATRYPDGVPDKVAAVLHRELALIAKLKIARYFLTIKDIVDFARALRPADPVPGARQRGQQRGLLLPRDHRGRSRRARTAVRPLHFGGAQGAARYRRRFRA